jgi:hypothetical protein
VCVHDFMLTRANTGEISSISKLLFFISSFKDFLCDSISYKFYIVKYMIRKYYRILVGNLKGSVHAVDITLCKIVIMKYIFENLGVKICLVISKW